MDNDATKKVFRLPSGGPRPDARPTRSWKVLVVDDEEEVHRVTRLILEGKSVLGRHVELVHAYSAAQAFDILDSRDDIACVFLDVVMETEDAGLVLARRIREEIKNSEVRIILRTGQPGQAPAERVIVEYEINDYKEKTELTAERLITTAIATIRAYRDILTIEASRKGMRMIIESAGSIFKLQSMMLFASGVLTQFMSLLALSEDAVYGQVGFTAEGNPLDMTVLAGTGKFQSFARRNLADMDMGGHHEIIERAIRERRTVREGSVLVAHCGNKEDKSRILYIENCPPLNPIAEELVTIFVNNVSSAYDNIELFEALARSEADKTELLREVHHRVKNNLQVVSSILNVTKSKYGPTTEAAFSEMQSRVLSMAAVHDIIYDSGGTESVDVGDLLREIATVAGDSANVVASVEEEGPRCRLKLTAAIPFALFANEMLLSCAAPDPAGCEGGTRAVPVALRLSYRESEGSMVFEIDRRESAEAASSRLECDPTADLIVDSLVLQLNGDLRRSGNGHHCVLTMPALSA